MTIEIPKGYETLGEALAAAVEQAAVGKGAGRHSYDGELFSDQLIFEIPRRLGACGSGFLLGQAVKKIYESVRLEPERARAEILGAINYLAAAWSRQGVGERPVPEFDAPRSKEELCRRIIEANPAIYQPEDVAAPLFPERTPVECRPPLESEWTPAFYIGVDPSGFHVVERGGMRMHLSADAVRKPEGADKPRFQKGEPVEYKLPDGTWAPANFLHMDGGCAVLECGGPRFRVLSFDVRPAEKF